MLLLPTIDQKGNFFSPGAPSARGETHFCVPNDGRGVSGSDAEKPHTEAHMCVLLMCNPISHPDGIKMAKILAYYVKTRNLGAPLGPNF